MVSQLNMAAYIFSAILCLAVTGILYVLLWRKNKSIETGMLGAIGYGVTGYLWGGLLFPIVVLALIGNLTSLTGLKENVYLLYLLFVSVFNAFFSILANVWGIFLTNQKQCSLFRSTTVGLGYGFTNAVIVTWLPLYEAVQVNRGAVEATLENQPVIDILSSGISSSAMVVFFALTAMLLGQYVVEKDWKNTILCGLTCYGGMNLARTCIDNLLPDAISPYISTVFMLIVGIISFRLIQKRLLCEMNRKDD